MFNLKCYEWFSSMIINYYWHMQTRSLNKSDQQTIGSLSFYYHGHWLIHSFIRMNTETKLRSQCYIISTTTATTKRLPQRQQQTTDEFTIIILNSDFTNIILKSEFKTMLKRWLNGNIVFDRRRNGLIWLSLIFNFYWTLSK